MSSLQFWQGEEGRAYTVRQPERDAAFDLRVLLQPWLPDIHSVLEVGCNRGDNLGAFRCEVTGVEPNEYARGLARDRGWNVVDAVAHNLPFPNRSFDLVYTAGVLIHIPAKRLDDSLYEIHRVTNRFLAVVEYVAAEPTAIEYRGRKHGIWKRPWGTEFLCRFLDLALVGWGDETSTAGTAFDGCSWWVFEKT